MMEDAADINQRIAARVRSLRDDRDLTLDALAARSGVSRSTISLIERAETSPTAVVLDKLAVGLGIPLAALLDPSAAGGCLLGGPVARREDQPEWRDPGSGYVRRTVSPPGVPQPLRIAEVLFPPGARVAFDNGTRDGRVYQQVWVLEGEIELTVGEGRHRLGPGDCLAMEPDQPAMFHNPTRTPARYAVVIATEPSTSTPAWTIRRPPALDNALIDGLADVLIDCVESGASVGFMAPLSRERARAFWRRVAAGLAACDRAVLVAEDAAGVCGTVQLVLALPENQPHRADVAKMLVHRRARRRGLGEALMRAVESTARERGKALLVLDAVTSGDAARLYERLGWVRAGDVPGYALYPDGRPCGTTFYYRDLRA